MKSLLAALDLIGATDGHPRDDQGRGPMCLACTYDAGACDEQRRTDEENLDNCLGRIARRAAAEFRAGSQQPDVEWLVSYFECNPHVPSHTKEAALNTLRAIERWCKP